MRENTNIRSVGAMTGMTKTTPVANTHRTECLPLTPPATVEKSQASTGHLSDHSDLKPKRLLPQLKRSTKKPRLTYRPKLNSVLNIDDYDAGLADKTDLKNVEFVRYAFQHSKRMIVITGAGISVAAGIPDFRSSNGLFSLLKGKNCSTGKELFDFNRVYSSEEMSLKFNNMITTLHNLSKNSHPTEFHKLLDKLALEGKLQRLYTQNIDGLDTRLANLTTSVPLARPAPKTIQLHGSIQHVECNKCCNVIELNPSAFKCHEHDQESSQVVPTCQQCEEYESVRTVAGLRLKGVGKLRPRIVLYNEIHPEGDIIGEITSSDLKKKPDCLIIAGTSLQIPGVKAICKQFAQKVRSSKGVVLYLNREMPSQSVIDNIGCIDLVLLGDCQHLPEILNDDFR